MPISTPSRIDYNYSFPRPCLSIRLTCESSVLAANPASFFKNTYRADPVKPRRFALLFASTSL